MHPEENLESRVRRLERRLRHTIALAVVAVLAVGLVAAKRTAPAVVDARAFVLVDESGNSRAQLALTDDGAVSFLMQGPGGRSDAGMTVMSDGSVALRLKNTQRTGTIEIAPDGAAHVRFMQATSKAAVELGIDAKGRPRIVLNDGFGKVVHQAP
ncbi:MAG: hypothetical protein RKU31_12875 [Deltaproteobacteria bacterium]|jgi:hypothetical protein